MAAWDIGQMRAAVAAHAYVTVGEGPPAPTGDEPRRDGDPDGAGVGPGGDLSHLRGVTVDVQTANLLVTVYDALNEANRARFVALPVERAATAAWRLVGR